MVPVNQSQRQAFKQLMPHLYALREKGCSFQQLTGLLNQCGFKLQPSTVRRYYNEMLPDRMEACKHQMKLQMESLAAVKRENLGIDMQAIATKLDKAAAQRRYDVDAMLAHMLGIEYRKPAHPAAPGRAEGS